MYRENSFLAMNIANNHTLSYSTWKLVPCDLYYEKLFVSILISIQYETYYKTYYNIPRKIRRKKSSSSNGKDAIRRDPLRYRFPLRDHRTAVKVGKRCDRRWPRRWIVGWKQTFEIFIRSFRRVRSRYSRRCRDRGEKLGETRARVAPFQGEAGKRDRMRET